MYGESRPVVWGILSTAAIADLILSGCDGSAVLRFVAVASRDRDRANLWAARRQIDRAYGAYEDLLLDPDIEAVYVALPNSLHLEWATRAVQYGKHVLCEKPLSRDPSAVGEVFAVADRAGRLVREAFMYRFHPQTEEVKRLVTEGAIGALRHVRATLSYPMQHPEHDVRTSPGLDGGALMDVGCYCVSGYRLFAGEPAEVSGYAVRGQSGVDLRFLGSLVSHDGVTGQFDCGMTLPRRDALELVGDRGTIFVPDPWHCRGAPFLVDTGQGRMPRGVVQYDAYRAEFERMSKAIRGHCDLPFGRDDAVAQASVMQALHASANDRAWRRMAPEGRLGEGAIMSSEGPG